MAALTTITDQEQYNRYKDMRKSYVSAYTFGGYKIYNELTRLIVEWDIKQDARINRQKGKTVMAIKKEMIKPIEEHLEERKSKRIIRKA